MISNGCGASRIACTERMQRASRSPSLRPMITTESAALDWPAVISNLRAGADDGRHQFGSWGASIGRQPVDDVAAIHWAAARSSCR